MCSLSFLPRSDGPFLAMNRDERRTRPQAHPPALVLCGSLAAIHPSEPGGGTWMGVNERGLAFALLNWNSCPDPHMPILESRGRLIPLLLKGSGPCEAAAILEGCDLTRTKPFRLIMTFPRELHLSEWMWDGAALASRSHAWVRRHWFSSGFDEAGASRLRGSAARSAESDPDAETREWILRIHRSHIPEPSAYSICMHREDALTVSLTTIDFTESRVSMGYHDGPPCLDQTPVDLELSIKTSFKKPS